MASGWSPKPVLSVQVAPLPLSETIRLDEEHVSKTCSGFDPVASSSLAVSASEHDRHGRGNGLEGRRGFGRREFDSLMLR